MITKIHIYKINGRWVWSTRSYLSFGHCYPTAGQQIAAGKFCKYLNQKEPSALSKLVFGSIEPIPFDKLQLD